MPQQVVPSRPETTTTTWLDDVTLEDLRGDAMKMSMMKASVESNKQKYACDMPSECVTALT